MKIKIFFAAVILSTVALTQAHSFGLGAQFNYYAGDIVKGNFSAPAGFSVLFSPSRSFHISGNWLFGDDANMVGLTLDFAPVNLKIIDFNVGSFNFTLGIGAYVNVLITGKGLNTDFYFSGGARLPVGFSLFLFNDFLEVFAQVAPSIGVDFNPFGFDTLFFPIAVGARVWLF